MISNITGFNATVTARIISIISIKQDGFATTFTVVGVDSFTIILNRLENTEETKMRFLAAYEIAPFQNDCAITKLHFSYAVMAKTEPFVLLFAAFQLCFFLFCYGLLFPIDIWMYRCVTSDEG